MKVTLLTVVTLTAVATFAGAADPECVYRKLRGLSLHWPNPSSCSSYYRCSAKNVARSISCPKGKEYNPKTGKCSNAGRGLCKLSLAAPLAEVTNICANEVNGAYLVKDGYCSDFYICDEQLAYPQSCDLGSYFDIALAACVVDTDSECWQNQCVNQTNGVSLPSSTSCASYIVCQDNEATLQTCASGSYFDSTQENCVDDEDNSNCWENFCIGKPDGSTVADEDNCSAFYICSQQKATIQYCPDGSYFDIDGLHCVPGTCPDKNTTTEEPCSEGPTEAPTTEIPTTEVPTTAAPPTGCDCADGTQQGELVADPDNCRLYFKCDNGELVPGDCDQGNFFDKSLKSCVPDTNNCCPDSSTAECVDDELTLNPEDCNQYYQCQNGDWEPRTCASGSFFNTDLLSCVVDVDGKCPQCNSGNDNDSETSTTTSATTTTTEIVRAGGLCKETDAAISGDNCWSYFVCISGNWIKESCMGGFYFNATVGICRRDDTNQCPENKLLQPTSSRSRRSVDCPADMSDGCMAAHPTECDMYVICQNGQLVDGTCGQGNIFSNSEKACVPDTDATCWVCANKPNGYIMADPTDCTSYVTCSDGLAVPATCASGEWFDGTGCEIDVTGQCINPCTCVNGNGNVAHPICSKYFQCTDGVPQVVDCAAGQGFDAATGKCSAKVDCPAALCATAADGTALPVPGDTSRFYLCMDNVAEIYSCPANSAFDTTYLICLVQPSSSCDQTQCKSNTLNTAYPSLDGDESTFCFCESDGAYLNSCKSGYIFNDTLGLCTFTGPCDPQVCVGEEEYWVSVNYDDPNGFCVCRANQPTPVSCPIGYTFDSKNLVCVLARLADPRCCRNYCVGKPNYDTFPALDTDTGFCMCIEEVPSYDDCPTGKTYDATLGICLESAASNPTCNDNECDSTQCADGIANLVFPPKCNIPGFCICEDSCAEYSQCPEGKEFDTELLICLEVAGPLVCDATKCNTLAENQPYAADNGTEGFCYCQDGLPNYSLCPEGKEYNPALELCLVPLNGEPSCYCDSEKCSCLADYDTFPSTNTEDATGFCYCRGGVASYANCNGGKVYDAEIGICVLVEAPFSVCAAGSCANQPEDYTFAALNSTSGFCMCTEGIAIYGVCPEGKEYDAALGMCLAPVKGTGRELACDASQCKGRTASTTFAARDSVNGFCTCQDVGIATFQSCGEYQIFDKVLSVCVVDACDPTLCTLRPKYDAFAARNTTRGFCSCDIVPIYYHCTAGHIFDEALGVCVDEETATVAACDPRECPKRAQFEAFAAQNTTAGYCWCEGTDGIVTYHACADGMLFDSTLGVCLIDEHGIQKRSVEPLEKFVCEANKKRSVPANCSQYEICLDGNWRRRTCAEERYYNPEQQLCLEPRDDMVCSYARVLGLPTCDAGSESLTIPSLAGKGNCMQYFRCAAGRWRLRSCPKRHYYAPHVGTCLAMPDFEGDDFCEWLDRGESRGRVECQHLTVRPYPGGCDKFLMCMENAWWIQQCPLGMYFSQVANYCLPNDANQCRLHVNATGSVACIHGQKRALATSCRAYEECVKGEWIGSSCGQSDQFEPLLGCVTNDGSCQGSGLRRSCQPGELRALPLPLPLALDLVEANCTQFFYYCEADEWRLGSCLRGQSFDRRLNKCQSLDSCQAQLKAVAASSCAGQPDGQSVAHADDCTRFYLCLQQQPALLQSCTAGSFFDAKLGYCRPNDGSCRQMDAVCSNHTDGGLEAHPQNCRAYYNCSSSSFGSSFNSSSSSNSSFGQLLYCPEGQYFNKLLAQCRFDQGQCQSQALPHSVASRDLCTDVVHGVRLPHKLYCNLYYACVHGLPILAACEPKMRFNAVLGRCEESDSELESCQQGQLDRSGNSSAVYSCANLQDGSYVPDYRDCSKYFICAGGVALAQRCGNGSYFDASQLLCTQDDGFCPYVLHLADQNRTDVAASSDPVPPNPVLCEGKHGQLLPDFANCNNFYICISSKLRFDRCYKGYFFNATLQQCQSLELATDEGQDGQNKSAVTKTEIIETERNETKCGDAPTDFVNLCSALIGEGASIAEPGDCRRYISCDENEPISQRCRNGESYDSLLGICRQNDGTCLMENGERVGVCNGRHGQLARDTNNCRGYYVCLHGQRIHAECAVGQFFSKATNTCELDVLQQCNNNSNELAKSEE